MTPDQFAALARMMQMRNSAITDGVRLVLVDGVSQYSAAKQVGVHQQSVSRRVMQARRYVADAGIVAGARMPPRRYE